MSVDVKDAVPSVSVESEFGAYPPCALYTPPADPLVLKNLERWRGLKFGALISWQSSTQWGIDSWPLCPEQWDWNRRADAIRGTPEGAEPDHRKYKANYEALATTFSPSRFDPEQWAEMLVQAGVRYALVMAKHHDGFCFWDTAQTDYKTTSKNCPFHLLPGADVVRVVGDALRRRGIRVGIYFSKPDWHSPYFWSPAFPMFPPAFEQQHIGRNANYDPRRHPDLWERFKAFTWSQIEELVRDYGEIDILWLDGGWVNPSCNAQDIDMTGLAAMARRYQPGLLVVDRCVGRGNENYITPEGESAMPSSHCDYPWEACMPLGRHWNHFPGDTLKTASTLVRYLSRATARGGNYLLGVGPDAAGVFDPAVGSRLQEVGDWLQLNGEAIFDTAPLTPYEQEGCVYTAKRNGARYAIVTADDKTGIPPRTLSLPERFFEDNRRISLLGSETLLDVASLGNAYRTVCLPASVVTPAAGLAWVIKSLPERG